MGAPNQRSLPWLIPHQKIMNGGTQELQRAIFIIERVTAELNGPFLGIRIKLVRRLRRNSAQII